MAKIETGDDVRVRIRGGVDPNALEAYVAFSGITEVNINTTRQSMGTLDLLNGPNVVAQFNLNDVSGWSVASAEPD